jgi:integrase
MVSARIARLLSPNFHQKFDQVLASQLQCCEPVLRAGMVKSYYENLVQRGRNWYVRIIVPNDVRDIIGLNVFIKKTKQTDSYKAYVVGKPLIDQFKERIRVARESGKRLEQITAEQLAEKYRVERNSDPDKAELTKITDVIEFVLKAHGHSRADYARQVREAEYDLHTALRLLPNGSAAAIAADRITGHATPFLAYLEKWKPHAGVNPRPLDQAISSIKQFDGAVSKPLERLENGDVQKWIDSLINPDGETGLNSKTVNRKLGEINNYWRWLQSLQIVSEDRNPFVGRRVKEPASRKKAKDELRQRFRPEDVVKFHQTAAAKGDAALTAAIKIAMFSGARIEGVAQLQAKDIGVDPDTGTRFMRMNDKSVAGDRYVPVHPEVSNLINLLIKGAGDDGYLIASNANNKYGERSQPISKRFGRLKTELGFDSRYVFHSIRKTVAHMFETAECPPGIAKDILGHAKTDMTFGIYSGETKMDHRARWLTEAIRYPAVKDVRHPIPGQRGTLPPADEQSEPHSSD